MTTPEPTTSNTAPVGVFGKFARNTKAIIISATAGMAAIILFINNADQLIDQAARLTCTISPSLSWCEVKPVTMTWSDAVGGEGGSPFSQMTCRNDELLVGVIGRANSAPSIYSMGPICAPARFTWRHRLISVSDATRNGDQIGSSQGNEFSLKCPPGKFVIGYVFDSSIVGTNFGPHEYLVSPLRLRCSNGSTQDNQSPTVVAMTGQDQSNASHKPYQCPGDGAAFGIKGRAGQFVDAVSLGCRSIR